MCDACKDWDRETIVAKILMNNVARCPKCKRLAWPNLPLPDLDELYKKTDRREPQE